MQFKTIEEKQAALDAVSTDPNDAPVGVNHEDFIKETEDKIDEIMKAEVDETAEPVQEPVSTTVQAPVQEPVEQPVEDPNSEAAILKRNNEYLQMQATTNARDTEQTISDLKSQIDELKNKMDNPSVPEPKSKPKTETDHELIAVKDEIAALEKEMNENPDDEDEEDTRTEIKKLKKFGQLQLRLNALKDKKAEDLIKQQNSEIDSLKNEQRLRKEKLEENELEIKRNQAVEKFRETIPELQGSKKFDTMFQEYNNFSIEVASAYFNIPTKKVMQKDAEVAMAKYLEGSEMLNQALSSRGIVEPDEMRKFVILSEIDALRQGYVVDKLTGEFVQMKDPMGNAVNFPNHKAAYAYLQQENGNYGKNVLKAQEKTAKGMMHAMTRKEPVELTSKEHREVNLDNMTTERAMEMIEKYDTTDMTLRARKDIKDPLFLEYNKALLKLGHATITKDDL